jgi:hypothetical protein
MGCKCYYDFNSGYKAESSHLPTKRPKIRKGPSGVFHLNLPAMSFNHDQSITYPNPNLIA